MSYIRIYRRFLITYIFKLRFALLIFVIYTIKLTNGTCRFLILNTKKGEIIL